MKIVLSEQQAYLLRSGTSGADVILCDCDEMLRTVLATVQDPDNKTAPMVHTIGHTLRWRVVPKKDVRELARVAHYRQVISQADFQTISTWFK